MNKSDSTSRDSGILSNPLSFLHSGLFDWSYAGIWGRDIAGYYWSLRSYSTTYSNYLGFGDTVLNPQNVNYRGNGFAVRCVSNIQWSGGLAPDSICPKGWQLPTYSGDKSFTTLINTSYSMKNTDGEVSRDAGVLSDPLSFLRSGSFGWYNAGLGARGSYGDYWSLRSYSTTNSSYLDFGNTNLNPQSYGLRGYGFAVRLKRFPKSFTTLINTSYSMKNNGQTEENNRDSGVLSNPLSLVRNGDLDWRYARLDSRGGYGCYWSLRSSDKINSKVLAFHNTFLNSQANDNHGYGFAVRCANSLLHPQKEFRKY